MKYYVIWPDGQKFGPADVDTLNQWIQEGRVTPTTELESVATMARLSAASVPGLVFGAPAASSETPEMPSVTPTETITQPDPGQFSSPYGATPGEPNLDQPANSPYQYPPQPGGNPYPRPAGQNGDGQTEAIIAIICSIVGICCCIVLPIVGLVLAYVSKNKGNQLGKTAVIIGWVCLGLSIAGMILSFVLNIGMAGLSSFQ